MEKTPDPGFQYLCIYNGKTSSILQDCHENKFLHTYWLFWKHDPFSSNNFPSY